MNVITLYRHHPDLAELLGVELLGVVPEHLFSCPDCGQRFLPREMYSLDSQGTLGCGPCFDRRQETAWAEWHERLAKEAREETGR